jgi:hypothetical protein
MNEFPNDGHGLFVWLREYGKLEYDDTTKLELMNEWDEATMAKVGIKFTPNAIWEWLEYVETLGDKLGRSLAQRRRKLLAGFPESFDVITSPERLKPDPGTYVLPAVYPAYHPKSGQPDPNAGRPDLYALCKAYYPEWHYRIKSGQIKSVPRGSVYEIREHAADYSEHDDDAYDDDSDREALYSSVSRRQITSKSVCGVCGGRGHYGRVEGMDCLTKQLGIQIPRSELALTKYPSGISYPFSDLPGSSAGAHKKSMHGAHLASSTRSSGKSGKSKRIPSKHKTKSRQPSPRRKPKHVSQVDEHDSEHVEHEERTDQDEDQSSEGDPRADFAALAVTYSTIDIRNDARHTSTDESSDDSRMYRRRGRPH